MKKINALILFCLISSLSAIQPRTIDAMLKPFAKNLNKLSPEIKTMAVYGVLKDSKNRYQVIWIKSALEKNISANARFELVDRSKGIDEEVTEELELSQSGAVDYESLKNLGKMANIDAFVFAYPQISGKYSHRISIVVKIVEVRSSTIAMVRTFNAEEAAPLRLGLSFSQPLIYRNGINTRFNFYSDNAATDSLDVSLDLPPGIIKNPELFIAGYLPKQDLGLWMIAGNNILEPKTPPILQNTPITVRDHFFNYIVINNLRIFCLKLYAGISLPISRYFGDENRSVAMRVGGGINMYSTQKRSNPKSENNGNNLYGMYSSTNQGGFMKLLYGGGGSGTGGIIRTGFDIKLSPNLMLTADIDTFLKFSTKEKGGHSQIDYTYGFGTNAVSSNYSGDITPYSDREFYSGGGINIQIGIAYYFDLF